MRDTDHRSLLEELFETFPRGIALIELADPQDVATWRLAAINSLAATLVVPSIETFLSAPQLRLVRAVDLPQAYREVAATQRTRTIGMIEGRSSRPPNQSLYTMTAFPVGSSSVGIFFQDAHFLLAGRSARLQAERRLTQTCGFVGAILWKADPQTLQFTYVSSDAQALLGYWLERWTAETNFWKKHLVPDDCERVAGACEKILRERRRRDFEFRMFSVHGQIQWFHAAAEIADQPNGKPELVGVMNDITELKRAEERIRALTSRLMQVQDDERRHISRELHDSLGQYLTSIKINLELVKRESAALSEPHRELLAETSQTLEKCVQEVRSVSYLLHPPLLDELGLLAALRWFTSGFAERSGIDVNLNAPRAFSRLPQEMELTLFRILQESLTNVQRHSQSNTAWVTLSEHDNRAEIRISDAGVGIPAETIERITQGKTIEGVGLRGMYERVRELGGALVIESNRMGTAVSAVLPLQSMDENLETPGESEERKLRVAGKPLAAAATTDLRIETPATRTTDRNDGRGQERQIQSRRTESRKGSRRSR